MNYDKLAMMCLENVSEFYTNYEKIINAEKKGDYDDVLRLLENSDAATKKRLMTEGMYDRFKARAGQAKGAVQGVKQAAGGMMDRAKGALYNTAGNLANKAANTINQTYGTNIDGSNNALLRRGQSLQQQGNQKIQQAKLMPNDAKISNYINSVSQTLVNDFTKLGMPFVNPQEVSAQIQQFIYNLASNFTNSPEQSQPSQQQNVQESHENDEDYEEYDKRISFTVPTWALSALVNGDYSGLDDHEEYKVDRFIEYVEQEYGNALFIFDGEESEFSRSNDIDDLASTVAKVYIVK